MDHGNAAFMKVSLSRRSVLRGALAGAGAVGLTQLLAAGLRFEIWEGTS